MKFPISVVKNDSTFCASIVGNPAVRVQAQSREAALANIRVEIKRLMLNGDIVFVDIPSPDEVDFVGILADDPTLDELREEIYRLRDLDRPA